MAQQLKIDIVAKDRSKQALGKLQGSLAKVKASVFNLRNAFVGLGAGLVLRGIINAGMQIETLGVQLEALTGSAAKGKLMLKQVLDYAKNTPFELSNIQQGVASLATVSEKAEEMGISFEELLKITGNTAAQLGGDFALASQQIQKSFSAGIGAADLFRDKAITAMAGFSAGVKTSVDDSIKGLAKAFGTGGKFGELTDKLAQTLVGTISNLKDAFFTIQTEIAAGFFDELKKQLGDLKKFTETNDEAIRRLSRNMGENLAVAILKLSDAIKILTKNFRDFQSVLGLVLIAVGGIFAKLAGAGLIINDINRRIKTLSGVTKEAKDEYKLLQRTVKHGGEEFLIASYAAEELALKANEAGEAFMKAFNANQILSSHNAMHEMMNTTEQLKESFREMNQKELTILEDKIKNIGQTIKEGLNDGIKKTSDAIARTLVLGEKLSDTFKQMAQTFLVNIISHLIQLIARKSVELAIEKMITREKQKQLAYSGASNLMGLGSLGSFFGKASGGAVAKGQPTLVGERGAEMFIPNSSGQITQNARGVGGGGGTTVNFNINTVDARGFDELLTQSRGTITQLINQAVNERGAKSII